MEESVKWLIIVLCTARIRHSYEAASLLPYTKNYTLEEIVDATGRMLNLADNLIDLLEEIDVILKG